MSLSIRHPGGLAFDRYREFCAGADLLVHDVEFTYPVFIWKRGVV